jgi:membrane protease YdiL (CAAX protease family)
MSRTPDPAERQPASVPGDFNGATGAAPAGDPIARGMRVPWSLRQVIWGICLTALPLAALQVAVQVSPGAHAPTPTIPLPPGQDLVAAIAVFITSTILEAVFLIPPVYHALRTRERGTSIWHGLQALGFRGFPLVSTAVLFVAGFVLYFGFSQLYGLLNISTNADTLRRQALYAPYTTTATLLVAVIVAPFCEEVFFRGYVFPPVARAMPMWAAILVTAVFFGAVHVDLGSLVPLVAIGIVLAVLRWRSTSIWPGMLFHALNNGLAAVYVLATIAPHTVRI